MEGYRFYLSHRSVANKETGVHEGNCFAVRVDEEDILVRNSSALIEGVVPVFTYGDSPVASGLISDHVLEIFCTPISERSARRIHPKLFKYLEEGKK